MTSVDCPLMRTAQLGPTDYWNDSCAVDELAYAIERGATGATSNPSIVLEVMKKEKAHWVPRVRELAAAEPDLDRSRADLGDHRGDGRPRGGDARPGLRARGRAGKGGCRSRPTRPTTRDPARMVEQAVRFAEPGAEHPGQVPRHVGRASSPSRRRRPAGVNINATVSFTVPQALAAAEAVERGLDRLAAAGGDSRSMAPIVTLMIGRLDDWMKVLVERDGIAVNPDAPTGPGSPSSSAPTASSGSAATAAACSRRPTATTSTGPSWSAGTSA